VLPVPLATQPTEWTIAAAVDLQATITDDGRLRVVAKNKSPGHITILKITVLTSSEENITRDLQLANIGPHQQAELINDFPELRRRTNPKAPPQVFIQEGDIAESRN